MKLRIKFAFLIAGIIIVPILVTALIGYFRFLNPSINQPIPYYFTIRRWLKHDFLPEFEKRYPEPHKPELSPPPPPPPGFDILVFDLNDRIIFSSFPGFNPGSQIDPSEVLKNMLHDYPDYRFFFDSFSVDKRLEGRFLLRIDSSSKFPSIMHERIDRPIFVFLFFLIICSVLGSIMVGSLSRSIRDLEGATKKIAAGDLDFKLASKRNDEISSLTRSFDSMRKKLKEELARRSRFLMAVSHDLKTPLTSIKGYLEAISDGLAENPDVLKNHLAIIRDKSELLEARILELIDFVRMETGEWRMSHEQINLYDSLFQTAKIYREEALVFKRDFSYAIDIPQNTVVAGDKNLLSRALENLFNNALSYTEENDSISIKAFEKNSEILITIEDTGPGIPKDEIKFIFDPFYRGTSSGREQGFGLGLSTVKSIINAHGWEIEASSKPGEGTKFTIHIPTA